jgi:ABC-type antimicrobial peptide transport system permease subunit
VLQDLPENTDLKGEIFVPWSALKPIDAWLGDETRGWGGIRSGVYCYIRLNPGVSVAEVEEAMQPYVAKYRPNMKNVHHYKLQSLRDVHFDAKYSGVISKGKLWALSLVGLLLLVTACVNFVNLATAQALKRSKEVGVRKVLGGLKQQLFWQFIFETAIITFSAIAMSLILASVILPYIGHFFDTRIPLHIFSDWRLPLFIVALGIVVTFLAGFYPGLVLAGFQPITALKGKLSQRSVGGFNVRRTLIVAQFTLSQVLIIGMVVVMEQMRFARQSDLGFDKEGIVMVLMGNDSTGMKSATLKNEFSHIPAVEQVSICFAAPASLDDWGNSVKLDNDTEEVNFRTSIKSGDVDYISTFGLELAAGRNLLPADTAREILVNEAMIRKLNLGSAEEALGRTLSANGGSMRGPIVGVVRDFHDKSFHEDISAVLITTNKWHYQNYAIKMDMQNLRETMGEIERMWLQHHPNEVFQYEFLDDSIARFYQTEEATFKLIQFFSLIAIIIGSLGLYGLVSFMVVQKTKEVGVRKILGASVVNIAGVFGREFMYLILLAFVIAAPIGWWLMHGWLQDYKFQIPITGWTFVPALACSFVIAVTTVSYQVLKASFANPVKALRTE